MADECNVRVVCRYRPHNKIEERQGGKQVCSFPSKESVNQSVSAAVVMHSTAHFFTHTDLSQNSFMLLHEYANEKVCVCVCVCVCVLCVCVCVCVCV